MIKLQYRMLTAWIVIILFLLDPKIAFSQTSQYNLLEVESLGIPAWGYVSLEGMGIRDLKLWDGRIYIGHGEGTINTGPTEILSYNLAKSQFLNEYITDENCIGPFVVLDGQLTIPGQDCIYGVAGNIYILTEDGWTKYHSIPSTAHVTDATVFQKKWFVSTGGTSFLFDDGREYKIGTVMESSDRGKSFTLSYSTPSYPSQPGDMGRYRIVSLEAYREKLYAFPIVTYMLTTEEIPEPYRSELGAISNLPGRYRVGGRYIILADDPFGEQDALAYDGTRWRFVNLVPEENVFQMSGHIFGDQLLLKVLTGQYIHYTGLKKDFPAQACTKLYTFDGTQSRPVSYGGDNIRDVLIRNNRLFLLICKDDLWMIAETDNLEQWTYHVLPEMLQNPKALEFDGESFYIGMFDGTLFRSTNAKPITSLDEAQGTAPRGIHCLAYIPREGHWYWAAITDWQDLSVPARINARFRNQERIEVTLENVSGFMLFPPFGWINQALPVGIIVNGQEVFQGNIRDASALQAKLKADGEWRIETADVTSETYRPPKKVIGVAKSELTPNGELSSIGLWKAEVYRWAAGTDIAFAHQWGTKLAFTPGEIRAEQLFDGLSNDIVVTFRLTGAELRQMAECNIRRKQFKFRVAFTGIPATFEFHKDASKNRIIEWGLDDDLTYIVAGDISVPQNLKTLFDREFESTPTGLTSYQAAVRWFEAHHRVREILSEIQVIRIR